MDKYSGGFTKEQKSSIKNHIIHQGYKSGDLAQQIVQYAYDYTSGDMNFIYMMECESGMKPTNKGDNGKAYGLCQMNSIYHKIPQEYYDDWKFQIEYCYGKYKGGTKFYGSTRIIKGQYCADYVKNRFIIE